MATALLVAAAVLVAPQAAHAAVTRVETPASAAAQLRAVAEATHAAAERGYTLRSQQGLRTWTQLFDPVRRTLLTTSDDGRRVLDTPDAEFTPLDRAATTRTIVAEVGKARAAWSYVYDPTNELYSPVLSTWLSDRFVGEDPVGPTGGAATVIDSATLTTRSDGMRVWSVVAHAYPRTSASASTRFALATDAQDRLVWQTVGSQRLSVAVSYDAPTVAHPPSSEVIWTTLLAHARESYAARTGLSVAALAADADQRPLPRSPVVGDVGGPSPLSTPAVTTTTSKIHWATSTLRVVLSDAELRTHQGDSLVERVLVHRVRPIMRT